MHGHEKLTRTLFKIADAVNNTGNLSDLFASIHASLNCIIDASNFYIALYDREEDKITFPYSVDLADGRLDDITSASSSASLTSKVIQSGRPCFFNKNEMIAQANRMNLAVVGTPAEQWLGVPLKTRDGVIGAVVIQSYNDPDIYHEKDMALLVAVSDQVALAIERKRIEDAEAKSKAVNKILFSISNAVNTTADLSDLYRSIHKTLGNIIDLTNFIIGLWNRNDDTITFDYYVDQFDDLQGRSMPLDKGSVGRDVILSGKALFLKEKELKKKIIENQAVGTWARTWMGVPLKVEGEVIGYMAAQSFDSADIFSREDLEIFSAVSEQVALAIDRKRSHEDLKQSEKLTQALLKISNAVNTTENLNDLYRSIHYALKGVIDVTNFAIGIYDKSGDVMSYPYYMDETGDVYDEIKDVSKSDILAGEVIKHNAPIFITREGMTKRASQGKSLVGNASEQWLGVPLRIKNTVIGVIVVQSYEVPDRYTQKDADVLLSVSDQVALAIDRKQAQEEIKQSEKRTQALFNISNAVNTTDNMDALYASIYDSLNDIIALPNFLICVVDDEKKLMHFPFFIDEYDTDRTVPVTLTYRDAAKTITAEVIRTRQPRFYTEEMIKQRVQQGRSSGALSVIWLGVPLMIGDKVLGAMAVQHYTDPEYFGQKEMDLLMAVSDQVALALDRKQALENVRKSEALTRALYKISNAVNTAENIDELYHAIYRTLDRLKPLPNFIISVVNEERNTVSFPLFIDEFDKPPIQEELPYDDNSPSITFEVIKREKTLFLTQEQLEARHRKRTPLGHSAMVWLGVPLIVHRKVIGVMVVQHYSDPSYFVPEDIDLFVSVSDQVALAIDRKRTQDIILKHKNHLEKKVRERTEALEKTCTAFEMSEKRFREMAELLPQAVFEMDMDGRISYTNRHGLEISGYSTADYQKGIDVFQLVEPGDRERIRRKMARAVSQKKVGQAEFMLRKKDGTMIPVFLYSNAILAGDRPVGLRGVLLDLTERKRTEELMIQTEKMMSVGGLAAGMAHEINNPLAGMIQSSQVLKNRLTHPMPANEKVLEELGVSMEVITAFMEKRGILSHLDNIGRAGRRAAKIIENMLGFARKGNSVKQSHPLDDILEASIELALNDYDLKKNYDFKHIEITRHYAPDLPRILCEKTKIQQVIFNILKNASQAMCAMENKPDKLKISLDLSLDGDMAKIEIRDNGPGMDRDTRKKAFEPFFTTKRQGEGTGLGLSVSYFIIVDDHGGEMEVVSAPGKGTLFIIRLPLGASQADRNENRR